MKLIKDYNLTDASESVAWSGSLQLLKGTKFHYLEYHSGNGNHTAKRVKIDSDMIETVSDMNATDAKEYFDVCIYLDNQ